jgi:transmembrane sensor
LDELIIRVLAGDATAEESTKLAGWRQEAPENEARYEAVRRVWVATESEPLSGAVDLSVVSTIVKGAEERAAETSRARFLGRRTRAPVLRWALPVAAAMAAISFGLYEWYGDSGSTLVLEASAGGSETFVLDDGSFVRLAAGSRLSRDGRGSERRFELRGRALFAVTHDSTRPFVVVADGIEARVLGTRFEVRPMGGRGQQIAVLEGRVEVRSEGGRVEVAAGEVTVANPEGPLSARRPEDLLGMLDWEEGALLFQDTPLSQVAREVAWRYGSRVEVEGAALRQRRVTAWYGAEPFRDVVESLCAATGASCTVSDTLAVLR